LVFTGHSCDCDCDKATWQCSAQSTVAGRTAMTAVARFTLTPANPCNTGTHHCWTDGTASATCAVGSAGEYNCACPSGYVEVGSHYSHTVAEQC
jgi:hypothetical protein